MTVLRSALRSGPSALLVLAALAAGNLTAQAQAPASGSAPAAPAVSAAKKDLVQKVLKLQTPVLEGMARAVGEQALAPTLQQASMVLQQRVPPEKREALAQELQADAKKAGDEVVSLLRASALKLGPQTIGPMLEQRFTEDELKQLLAMLESPMYRKYQGVAPELQRAVLDKLVNENRPVLEPKLRALQDSIGRKLSAALPGAAASGAARPPAAAPASKP